MPSLMLENIFKNLLVEYIQNYKSNSPDAYSFLCKVSFVVFVVIPSSKRKGSNMNPLLSEYTKTPSVVAADHDKPNSKVMSEIAFKKKKINIKYYLLEKT